MSAWNQYNNHFHFWSPRCPQSWVGEKVTRFTEYLRLSTKWFLPLKLGEPIFLPREGRFSPCYSSLPFVSKNPKTSTAKESQSICLLYTPQILFLKGAFSFFLNRNLGYFQAMLSSVSPVLCPVLYCYIHSRTDFNFWVISLYFKFLIKLTYTLVKNHNISPINWLCYCSCVFLFWGLGKKSISPLHHNWQLHLK